MEQSGISIIPTPGMPDNSKIKSKSIGITLRRNSSIEAAKEKLKTEWLTNLCREEATGWEVLMYCLGEVIGTAILVFIGCTGCIGSLGVSPDVLQISLTFGLAVMIAIQCIGHISGAHINPSITIAALILGKKSLPMALVYIGSQCVGSLLGYSLLKVITPSALIYYNSASQTSTFCVTTINQEVSIFQAFMAEFLATATLTLFACGAWDYRNKANTDSVSMRFGLCVTVLCFVFIPYTGCSLNPARTFGPAVWNGSWAHHWLYWVAPMSGAAVAAMFYQLIFGYIENEDDGEHSSV